MLRHEKVKPSPRHGLKSALRSRTLLRRRSRRGHGFTGNANVRGQRLSREFEVESGESRAYNADAKPSQHAHSRYEYNVTLAGETDNFLEVGFRRSAL
jgi:hypothetical protein